MSTYRIEERTFGLGDEYAPTLLASAHSRKQRPVCLCTRPPVAMYVAKVGTRHVLKRMPGTGSQHAPACDSYEPPPELSGLGELAGAAIQEDIDKGVTHLRFGFGLSKQPGRVAPAPSGAEADSVKSDGKKLTLRATLHYLWDQAGFHRWTPAMRGRRSWPVIRKYLCQAAQDKRAKGADLDELLFVPEAFRLEDKLAIDQRRAVKLAPLAVAGSGTRKLMILVGEVKEVRDGRFGKKLVVKHLPDYPFMLDMKLFQRLEKRFAAELALWDGMGDSHLIVIATFGVNTVGVATVEEAALMVVNEQWVPFENDSEHRLLQALVQQDRSFVKGLRYNLDSQQPLAAAIASDCQPRPVALYIVPTEATDEYRSALSDLVEGSALPAWFWQPGVEGIPLLPEREGHPPACLPLGGIRAHAGAAEVSDGNFP